MNKPNEMNETRFKVDVVCRERLQDITQLNRLEMPLELALEIVECLRDFYTNGENNLLALLAPPGQDGPTRFVDAAVEIDRVEFGGGYEHALHQQRIDHHLEDRELVGFASVFPVEDDIATAFSLGHRIWISLGNKLIKNDWDIATIDTQQATVWTKRGAKIEPIQVFGIE